LRSYHRKTLIKKEGWPLVDSWYWCPESVVKKRIRNERDRLKSVINRPTISIQLLRWESDQLKLDARLAHACHDGRIRAPSGHGIEYYRGKGGITKLYGKCRYCDEALSNGIKFIIFMELEL